MRGESGLLLFMFELLFAGRLGFSVGVLYLLSDSKHISRDLNYNWLEEESELNCIAQQQIRVE